MYQLLIKHENLKLAVLVSKLLWDIATIFEDTSVSQTPKHAEQANWCSRTEQNMPNAEDSAKIVMT